MTNDGADRYFTYTKKSSTFIDKCSNPLVDAWRDMPLVSHIQVT